MKWLTKNRADRLVKRSQLTKKNAFEYVSSNTIYPDIEVKRPVIEQQYEVSAIYTNLYISPCQPNPQKIFYSWESKVDGSAWGS